MTTDEENLILDNINMAYDLAFTYHKKFNYSIELEELQSLCLLGITKAAKTFNKSLGFNFSTYAYSCMRNEIIYFFRQNKKYNLTLSIEDTKVDNLRLEDTLQLNYNMEQDVETSLNIEKLYEEINKLSERHRKIMIYYLQGLTMQQIGDIIGLSQPHVSREYNKALNILRYKFEERRKGNG